MLTPVIAATAVLAIAGSSIVYAQQRFGDHRGFAGGPRAEQRYWPSAEDIAAFADARIAALRAGLELTPDQAKNWPAFEQALRDMAQLRIQRMQARQAGDRQTPTTPFDRLARRADNIAKVGAALKRVADAGAPVYESLSDAQKHRFRFLAHILRPHWMVGGEVGRDGHGRPGGYFQHREGGMHGMMGRDRDDGGPHGMMGPTMGRDRDDGGPHGMMGPMMGRDRDDGGPHGMMGPMMGRDRDDGGPRGMMGYDRDDDSDDL